MVNLRTAAHRQPASPGRKGKAKSTRATVSPHRWTKRADRTVLISGLAEEA